MKIKISFALGKSDAYERGKTHKKELFHFYTKVSDAYKRSDSNKTDNIAKTIYLFYVIASDKITFFSYAPTKTYIVGTH